MIPSILESFRNYRHRTFRPFAEVSVKLGITPSMITAFSLLSGLMSVYFLFQHYLFFLLFGILHLFADALDGPIAAVTGKSIFGRYFDSITDNLVAWLLMVKIGYFLQDYYAYIVAGLYLLAQLIYLCSKMQAPVLFGRSVSMMALFFYVPAAASITSSIPVFVYLFAGVISVYSLGRQLQWFLEKRIF